MEVSWDTGPYVIPKAFKVSWSYGALPKPSNQSAFAQRDCGRPVRYPRASQEVTWFIEDAPAPRPPPTQLVGAA